MRFPLTATSVMLMITPSIVADDWPQWMGPKRDNVWREDGILTQFPDAGLKQVWSAPVAGGYAGPAVAEGRVFVTDYVTAANVKVDNFDRKEFTGTERVLCLDADTGKELWKHEYPAKYAISYPAGPRCTPIVDGNRVYTLGAVGDLFCFDVETGKVLWSKNFPDTYGQKPALWGYAGHPLIDGDHLICVAGGKGSHAVALDKMTGKEVWRALSAPEQGYSPPTIIEAAGQRQLILLMPDKVASVDPKTGELFWSVPYDATSGSIIMSPIQWKNYLYVAGYSNKNLLLKLPEDKPGAEVVWRDKSRQGVSPVNVQPFLKDDVMYGFDQNGTLYAVKLPEGERLWGTAKPLTDGDRAPGSGTAFIVQHKDGQFYLFTENGELIIAELTPEGYTEIDRTKVIEPSNVAFGREVVWCAPAFAGKRMYVRNDKECKCVELSAE